MLWQISIYVHICLSVGYAPRGVKFIRYCHLPLKRFTSSPSHQLCLWVPISSHPWWHRGLSNIFAFIRITEERNLHIFSNVYFINYGWVSNFPAFRSYLICFTLFPVNCLFRSFTDFLIGFSLSHFFSTDLQEISIYAGHYLFVMFAKRLSKFVTYLLTLIRIFLS